MPVSTESTIAGPFIPNGSTTEFAFAFKGASANEVAVVDQDGTYLSSALYSVVLDDDEGGTVVFSTAPDLADYDSIYIIGDPSLTQPSDFDNAGPSFNPAALTRALDRAALRDLKQQAEIDRAFKVPFDAASVAGQFPVVLPGGALGFSSGTGADDGLRTDLASDNGASFVAYKLPAAGAVARTQESHNRDRISVMDFIPVAFHEAIRDRTSTQDVTSYIQAALDHEDTSTFGSFEVFVPDGTYCISGSGARILEIPRGVKLLGASLEGTRLKVLPGSTSPTALEDDGSAAKIEGYNLTVDGDGNTSLTVGVKLGHRGIQFGTWGCLDNITVRGMPNATAFMLNCNIVQCGKLYSLDTKDGLISSGAGSGLHVETFTPTAFSGIGLQLALSDSVNYYEAEAMTSNDAIPIYFNRGGAVLNFFMSVAPATQIKTPVKVNSTYVDDFYLGQSIISLFDATAKWGDTTTPDDSGTATSADISSLTCSSKNWGRGQFTGGVIHITGGTGVNQMRRISGNSKTKISIVGDWSITPDATSTFAISYFVRSYDDAGVSTGGYAASDTFTFGKPATRDLTVTSQLTANQMLLGKSADAQPINGIMKVVAVLDFPSVAAGGVQALTVNVEGAQASMPVTLGVPSALQAVAGMAYSAAVSAAGVVSVYAKNSTAGAIDPASGTFVVQVFDY